jgi:hypothetical protein
MKKRQVIDRKFVKNVKWLAGKSWHEECGAAILQSSFIKQVVAGVCEEAPGRGQEKA